jgi:hypothetical protein
LCERERPEARDERRGADVGVRFAVALLEYLRWLVPYEWAAAVQGRRGRLLPLNFVAVYSSIWFLVLVGIFALVPEIRSGPTAVKIVCAALPMWASFEVTRWWLAVLLNRQHNRFVAYERNLLYLLVNLIEVGLAGAVLLRMTSPTGSARQAAFESFFLTTQLSNAPQASAFHDLAQILTAGCSLVLLAGGLAILVGGMGRRFKEGSYEGPWPLPVPRWLKR